MRDVLGNPGTMDDRHFFFWNKGFIDVMIGKKLKAKHGTAVMTLFGEAETGGYPVLSQPGLYMETLFQKERMKRRKEVSWATDVAQWVECLFSYVKSWAASPNTK